MEVIAPICSSTLYYSTKINVLKRNNNMLFVNAG